MSYRSIKQTGKEEIPPESLTDYYEDRKKLILKKLTIAKDEKYILNIIKKSQIKANQAMISCLKGGFFNITTKTIFNLSVVLKENIANYSLVIFLYFKEKNYLDALRLFLLMCEQNKKIILYLSNKIIEQLPRVNYRNRIAMYYPSVTKIMLQIISVYIKLAGKFNKSTLENFYIEEYLKIVRAASLIGSKFNHLNQGKRDENNNQSKNEKKFFYSQCLFDSSIYIFNRFKPLSITISILQHILEIYTNYFLNEIESIFLLKVNYNLALFYYSDGINMEAINNMNQAKERLFDIKSFPISKKRKSRISLNEKDLMMNKLITNNSNNNSKLILDFQEIPPTVGIQNSRNKFQRNSLRGGTNYYKSRDSLDLDQQSSLNAKKTTDTFLNVTNTNNNFNHINNHINFEKKKIFKQYSTIFLGAYNLLKFKNPIELDLVREKILIEIELILSEIELQNKNYKESLNHINYLLNLQNNSTFLDTGIYNRDSIRIIKTKTVNSNYSPIHESIENRTRFILYSRKNIQEKNNVFLSKENSNSANNHIKENANGLTRLYKYNLTNCDKSRIMKILEEIETSSWKPESNETKNKTYIEENKYSYERTKLFNKDQKIITSKEMEKFFIFICGLSIYQLKILNDTQPEPSRRRNDLPIIFNNQFQDCLTNSQRMTLSLLETMSLSRYILLKDTNKDISLDNLDYRFMQYRIKDKDSDEEYVGKKKKKKRKKNYKKMSEIRNYNKGFKMKNCNTKVKNNSLKYNIKYEFEEQFSELNYATKKNNKENKNAIGLHKKGYLKLMDTMNKEEKKIIKDNPELFNKLINDAQTNMKKKEN